MKTSTSPTIQGNHATSMANAMQAEFYKKAIIIEGLPEYWLPATVKDKIGGCYLNEVVVASKKQFLATIRDGYAVEDAVKHIESIDMKTSFMLDISISASITNKQNLLFVGNIGTNYSNADLRSLCSPFGPLVRSFVVCNDTSGTSKGYGFVEFLSGEDAHVAKSELASSLVEGRAIRVDWVAASLTDMAAVHSRTLFIDRLPRSFFDGERLKHACSVEGTTLTFCQVAYSSGRSSSGKCRGFALVDYQSYKGAEIAQKILNNFELAPGIMLRAAFGNPSKLGISIFSQKASNSQGQKMNRDQRTLKFKSVEPTRANSDSYTNVQRTNAMMMPKRSLSIQPDQAHYNATMMQNQTFQRAPMTRLQHQQYQLIVQRQLQMQSMMAMQMQVQQQQQYQQQQQQQRQIPVHFQHQSVNRNASGPRLPMPTLVAPSIQRNIQQGQSAQTMNVPTFSQKKENQKIVSTTKMPASSLEPSMKSRQPLKLVNLSNKDSDTVPTILTSPKSLFSRNPIEPPRRKRRAEEDSDTNCVFVETKRQYSEQHNQGLNLTLDFNEPKIAISNPGTIVPQIKRRRSNMNIAIPSAVGIHAL